MSSLGKSASLRALDLFLASSTSCTVDALHASSAIMKRMDPGTLQKTCSSSWWGKLHVLCMQIMPGLQNHVVHCNLFLTVSVQIPKVTTHVAQFAACVACFTFLRDPFLHLKKVSESFLAKWAIFPEFFVCKIGEFLVFTISQC